MEGSAIEPQYFSTVRRWRQWLRRNGRRDHGVWVLMAKKGTKLGIAYPEALEEALCWGWIDGKLHRHDDRYFALWFAPRRRKSIWSESNRRTVERLMAEGRMQPAGMAQVEEAKTDGRWNQVNGSRAVPRMSPDVRKALDAAGALSAFRALAPSRKGMLLYWITEAKRPETRARRIAQLPSLVRENRLPGFQAN